MGGNRTFADVRNGWKADISRVNVASIELARSTRSGRRFPICRICDKFWEAFSAYSDAWEQGASNEDQLFWAEPDETRALIRRAAEIEASDGATAFRLYLEAAEAGSAWSMAKVGWHYWTGTGVAADLPTALEYYRRAICGGSWIATIAYARLLEKVGRHDECERTLEEGVASGFVPSYFWLAWLRHHRSPTAEMRRDVRPLLHHAAEQGHPEAKLLLGRWMMLGKLRLRDVPQGFSLVLGGLRSFGCRSEQAAAS